MWHAILHRRNQYPNGRSLTELWRYVDFPGWRPCRRKSTSAFWFYDASHLGRQRTICIPNFDQISQSTADYYYFRLLKNKRPPIRHIHILLPVSTLTFSLSSVCNSARTYQILYDMDERQSYDVILILQDGGHSVANLPPVSGLATSDI